MSQCLEQVHGRTPVGILGRGRQSTVAAMPRRCSRRAVDGGLYCAQHGAIRQRMDVELTRRRNELDSKLESELTESVTTTYGLEPTPAGSLRDGARILAPCGVVRLTSRPLRLSGPGIDQQWVTLRFTYEDGSRGELVVHEGDFVDVIVGES